VLFGQSASHKRYRPTLKKPVVFCRSQSKPEWVRGEIIYLKARMPNAGCRQVAIVFNRKHAHRRQMTVSKSYVASLVKKCQYEILAKRREIKHQIPKPTPPNLQWQIDLTGKRDEFGNTHNILGIIDSGTRLCLDMKVLPTKATIEILQTLLDTIKIYGKPTSIRTDNERIFTSGLFRLTMFVLNIKHQRSDLHCPWQNGRIERLFGTLKQKLDRIVVSNGTELNLALGEFRFWYNVLRPHQHLYGRTPMEVW
jgi:putative transposase